jgi:hypothetical protein
MEMKLNRTIWIIAVVGIIATSLCWVYRPYARPDMAKVHPRLTALIEPYQKVDVGYLMDGGSISIDITDAEGNDLQVAVPARERYESIYFDTLYVGTNSSVAKINSPQHTALRLQEIIEDHKGSDKLPLVKWRDRDRDYIRIVVRWCFGYYWRR